MDIQNPKLRLCVFLQERISKIESKIIINISSLYKNAYDRPCCSDKEKSSVKKMKTIINRCYDKYMSTKDIIDDFGFITFARDFKYLGSVISYDLDDSSGICLRI